MASQLVLPAAMSGCARRRPARPNPLQRGLLQRDVLASTGAAAGAGPAWIPPATPPAPSADRQQGPLATPQLNQRWSRAGSAWPCRRRKLNWMSDQDAVTGPSHSSGFEQARGPATSWRLHAPHRRSAAAPPCRSAGSVRGRPNCRHARMSTPIWACAGQVVQPALARSSCSCRAGRCDAPAGVPPPCPGGAASWLELAASAPGGATRAPRCALSWSPTATRQRLWPAHVRSAHALRP